jgi:hypothetical protein
MTIFMFASSVDEWSRPQLRVIEALRHGEPALGVRAAGDDKVTVG